MKRRSLSVAIALALAPAPAAAQLTSYIDSGTRKSTPVETAKPFPVNPVVQASATDRGAVVGTSSVQLMPANAARRGFGVQNQSATASCYLSGQGAATADYHSLIIGPGGYFEPDHHVGTSAIFIVCTAASTPVFAREW